MTDWRRNLGADGKPTFLLPGETSITSEEMRRRTAEYYRQVRGRYQPREAIARKALSEARALLGMPEPDRPDQTTGKPPPYPRT